MSGKKKKGYDKSVYRSFALIMQFGINMLVPICAMSALGIYIDKKIGTSFVMILLFFAGALAGARNVYRMAKYSFTDSSAENNRLQNNTAKTQDSEIKKRDEGDVLKAQSEADPQADCTVKKRQDTEGKEIHDDLPEKGQ